MSLSPELRKMAEEAGLVYRGMKNPANAFSELWGAELEAFARLVAESCAKHIEQYGDVEYEHAAVMIREKYGIAP